MSLDRAAEDRAQKWREGPQPGRNHRQWVGEIRAKLRRLPGIELAGAYLDGISVSDALTSGVDAARAAVPGGCG